MTVTVLATANRGKLAELTALLADLGLELRSQADFAVTPCAETGASFVENALLKARHAARHTGLAAIADDSGLAVDCLQGAPGVYSARYAGSQATDRENIDKLLQQMAGVDDTDRTARFHCALVYLASADDPVPLICQTRWEGVIARHPRGVSGFGYDPVFLLPGLGKTAAELEPALKNRLSHRGQALQQLKQTLVARCQ